GERPAGPVAGGADVGEAGGGVVQEVEPLPHLGDVQPGCGGGGGVGQGGSPQEAEAVGGRGPARAPGKWGTGRTWAGVVDQKGVVGANASPPVGTGVPMAARTACRWASGSD